MDSSVSKQLNFVNTAIFVELFKVGSTAANVLHLPSNDDLVDVAGLIESLESWLFDVGTKDNYTWEFSDKSFGGREQVCSRSR